VVAFFDADAELAAGATEVDSIQVFICEDERGERITQVPHQVGRHLADEHVRPHPGFEVVVNRTQVQIVDLDVARVNADRKQPH
jgi:hypothetical protein